MGQDLTTGGSASRHRDSWGQGRAEERAIVTVDGGRTGYLVGVGDEPVTVARSAEEGERERALAKLTERERRALGLQP